MLRHYDEIGLLVPKSTDRFTGYRYYAEDQLTLAGRITALKDMGFGLAAIGEILHSYHDPQALVEFLTIKKAEMQAEAQETGRRLLLLDTAIQRLRKDETSMNYSVSLKTMPERYVASVRQVIPAYDKETVLWHLMMQETADLKMQPAENCYSLAIFHDEEYKECDVDVEVQGAVKGVYRDTEHVKFKTVPAQEIASATYQGSYEQLTAVNHAVANWMQDNSYEMNGAMFCIYHVSPAQTQDPEKYVTEVCYPVKKK